MIARYLRLALQTVGALTIAGLAVGLGAVAVLPGWLQYEDRPAKVDYIVPLAGNNHRLLLAIELYRQGYAQHILIGIERERRVTRLRKILSDVGYPIIDPREVRARLLAWGAVPTDAVSEFGSALVSTVEEAEALKKRVGDRPFSAIIVSSPYNSRRAKLTFERIVPNGRFLIAVTPEERIESKWWRDRDSALLVLNETAKTVFFLLGGAFRGK
jgi:uncharacterized SAM-binding protein YcdF (DUF218 family)